MLLMQGNWPICVHCGHRLRPETHDVAEAYNSIYIYIYTSSRQLRWKCTDPCTKNTSPLQRGFVYFHVIGGRVVVLCCKCKLIYTPLLSHQPMWNSPEVPFWVCWSCTTRQSSLVDGWDNCTDRHRWQGWETCVLWRPNRCLGFDHVAV